jgi:hypothetical protein
MVTSLAPTTYMGLQAIAPGSVNWYSIYSDTLAKIDTLGQAIRRQAGAGQSMAIRVMLNNGALVDAIRIVPDQSADTFAVYLGRAGKADRIVIQSSQLFVSMNLKNQNPTATDKICSVGATWSDEDTGIGDGIQDTTVLINNRNNFKTIIEFPPAQAPSNTNPYLGSVLQLSSDPSGTGANTPFIKFTCQTTTGTVVYLVPVYTV